MFKRSIPGKSYFPFIKWKYYHKFLQICIKTLDKLVPQKKNYSRRHNMPFISKTIKKAFMKRSRLRKIYLKNRSDNNKREYDKQRNYCVSLLRKTKTSCYANLNEKDLTVNKQFGQTVKPWLSHKIKSSEKIAWVEHRETLDMDGNINNESVNDDVAVFPLRLLLTWKFLIFMGWFR